MALTRDQFLRLCAGGLAAVVLPACGGNNAKPDASPGVIDAPGADGPKPVDAAIDARQLDAQQLDAQPVDAPPAVDAAQPVDAPAVDAPPVDAPPVDAPPVDAPPVDAPPVDAPPVDAPPIDAPPIDAPPMSGCTQIGTKVTIEANHGHIMSVSKADVIAGVMKTYNIAGSGGHSHFVVVTPAMFMDLQNGTPVSATSTNNGHTHDVTIACL